MPVVAVVNRKGGSGKSTLATHLAGYCASKGIPVMLGDVDRQQSTQTWLRLREGRQTAQGAPILGWIVDPKNVLRVPPGISHVILDTPGGMQGFELARVVMFADVILMPVCNSVFDRESAAECYAELLTLPRVASGRCKVAAVGMRLDARTKAAEVLKQWADKLQLPFVGVLRETQGYVKAVEQGLTLFDTPGPQVETDMAQWQPILQYLHPVLHAAPQRAAEGGVAKAPVNKQPVRAPARPLQPAGPTGIRPAGQATVPGALQTIPGALQTAPGGLQTVPGALDTAPGPLQPAAGLSGSRPQPGRPQMPARPQVPVRPQAAVRDPVLARTGGPAPGSLAPPAQLSFAHRLGRLLGALPIPGFMQRH
jgi:chromosome partitioning protein